MAFHKMPPIGALEAFFVVAERQSLKAAAPELNISVSALSRRIQTLEAHLGLVLFDRRARALRLTDDGVALLQTVSTAFETLQSSISGLQRGRSRPSLRVGAPAGLTSYWLTARLAAYKAAQPLSDVTAETSDLALSRLGSGLDALIVVAQGDTLSLSGRYAVQYLAPVTIQAVCAPFLAASMGGRPPAMPASRPVLVAEAASDWLGCWLQAAGLPGPPLRIERFDSLPVLLEAAANGLGMGLVPDLLAIDQVAAGRLTDPFGVRARTGESYFLVVRASDTVNPALQRFRIWLVEQFDTTLWSHRAAG